MMNCATKSTSLAFETLKAVDGVVQHIRYHQERFDATRKALFSSTEILPLASLLQPPKGLTCRVRICYGKTIESIEYIAYQPRNIQTFTVVESALEYSYKWCDRDAINQLIPKGSDDIIITHDGLLKDSSIANIALLRNGIWLTPKKPLLEGTTRKRLLEAGSLHGEDLTISDIEKAEKFAIMNALIGFKIIENVKIIKGRQ